MRKSIDPMSDSDKSWERQLGSPPQCSSAAMSFQSAIPWQVALRQSLPPLHRLVTILNNPLCRTMIFQRTATTPLTSCLSPRVHSRSPLLPRFPPSHITPPQRLIDPRLIARPCLLNRASTSASRRSVTAFLRALYILWNCSTMTWAFFGTSTEAIKVTVFR